MTWAELTEQISALLEPWAVGDRRAVGTTRCGAAANASVQEHLPHLPQVREERPGRACIDLIVEREADRVTRVDYEGYSPGQTLAHLGLVRQAQEYAAAVPGPVGSAGPAVLAALRLVLAQEDVHHTSQVTFRRPGLRWPWPVSPPTRAGCAGSSWSAPRSGSPVKHPRIDFGRWSGQHEALAAMTTWDRAERMAAYYAEPRPHPAQIRTAAADFPGPVTVLHGELDLHPTTRQARDFAALFPHGEAVELAGAGHYPWLDDAETFGDALVAALHR